MAATKYKDQKANVILRKHQKHSDLAEFSHGCCGAPVVSTFITGIKNSQFITWPGLTANLILKHLPPSQLTTRGHLHQESQHLQSTMKPNTSAYLQNIKRNIARLKSSIKGTVNLHSILEKYIKDDAFPFSSSPNTKTHAVIYTLIESSSKGIGYIDLTGHFPYRSTKGNQYIFIAYHFDANAIYGHAIKNREAKVITSAWEHINKKFATAGKGD